MEERRKTAQKKNLKEKLFCIFFFRCCFSIVHIWLNVGPYMFTFENVGHKSGSGVKKNRIYSITVKIKLVVSYYDWLEPYKMQQQDLNEKKI